MTTELLTDLDGSITRRFGTVADDARVARATTSLEANGISVLRAADAAEARGIVLGLIPAGSPSSSSMRSSGSSTRSMLMAGKPDGETPIYSGPYVD